MRYSLSGALRLYNLGISAAFDRSEAKGESGIRHTEMRQLSDTLAKHLSAAAVRDALWIALGVCSNGLRSTRNAETVVRAVLECAPRTEEQLLFDDEFGYSGPTVPDEELTASLDLIQKLGVEDYFEQKRPTLEAV